MTRSHEFTVTRDVYHEVEMEDGVYEVKLVKKDVRTKWFCRDISSISSCEQAYNDKGNIRRDFTKINIDGEGEKLIHMRYKDTKQLIDLDHKTVGYR